MSAVLKEVQAPADALLQFLEADVPLRRLIAHGVTALDWLSCLAVAPLVLTYPDGRGGMVVEEVSKLELIERGHQLGWTPDEIGDTDILCWDQVMPWEDSGDSPNKVQGHWFAHQDCMDWDAGPHGAPLTIPTSRLEELQREGEERRARYAAERRECEELAEQWEEAFRHDRLVRSRIHGRLDRDGVTLPHSLAFEEVDAIAAVHGIDPESEDTLPPFPWTAEQKHEIARVMRFTCDVAAGKPVVDCKPLGAYVPEEQTA